MIADSGVSSFASIGNRADITANDLLEYWESDGVTDLALLYIESFSDPRRFSRVAQRVGREMPVVVVKSGRSAAGQRATSSHTGALLAASDVTVDALFEQAGVIRTETLAELLDVASLLASQPLPEGPRVGIVTNAGGPGIMCADACEAAGLEVPEVPEEVRERLAEILPSEAGRPNPVDMIATATAEHYRETIRILSEWDGIDALIVIFIRPLLIQATDVAAAIGQADRDHASPHPAAGRLHVAAGPRLHQGGERPADPQLSRGRGPGTGPRDATRGLAAPAGGGAARAPGRPRR